MLIDLEPPRTIAPGEYPGRLVIALRTGGDKTYGITPADPEETPPAEVDNLGQGLHAFEIALDPTQTETLRYKATSWHQDVYLVTFVEVRPLDNQRWSVSFHGLDESPTVVQL
jgi:hypothetical protein